MTGPRVPMVVALVAVLAGAAVAPRAAAAAPSGPAPVSVEQRAQALLGLGRIARDQGRCAEAIARFDESAALRPFDAAQREEFFWIAAQCEPARARQVAVSLVGDRTASPDVHARRLALLRDPFDADLLRRALADAEQAYPTEVRWTTTRAELALALERRGDAFASRAVWDGMRAPTRDAQPDWEASYLRVLARTSRAGAVAVALDRYTTRYPEDAGMRALAIEALSDAGQPARALALLQPQLGPDARVVDLRRGADLARAANQDAVVRTLWSRAYAHPDHRREDGWRWAEALAEARDTTTLRQLLVHGDFDEAPCRERLVQVVTMAGADALLVDLLPALPASCRGYADVAMRVAPVLLDKGDGAAVERWLAPLRNAEALDDTGRVLLARAFALRHAWFEVDALLAPMVLARPRPDAADLLVWAWQALGRSQEAWRLAVRVLEPARDSAERQAGWAALALSAGDVDAATRLAAAALASARDIDARVVLASIAARAGRAEEVERWLAPVAAHLRDAGQVTLWLDAVHDRHGPAVALDDHAARVTTTADVGLLARLAIWSTEVGRNDDARGYAERVRGADVDRAARLDVEMALAADAPAVAWTRLAAIPVAVQARAPQDWARLRLDVALAAHRWDAAAEALTQAADGLTPDERVLAGARLDLGRSGTLDTATRASLLVLVTAGTRVAEARLLLARDDLAAGDAAEALARLPWPPTQGDPTTARVDVRTVATAALMAAGRPADVLLAVTTSEHEPFALQMARGRALFAVGRTAEARSALEGLAHRSGRVEAYMAWSEALDDVGARVEVLARALALDPDRAEVRAAHAQAQARLAVGTGDWPSAVAAIARLQQLTPDDPGVALLEAQVTAWSGAHEQAVPLYRAYLARQPGDITAWREFARLSSWREDQEATTEAYARVRALTSSPVVEAEANSRLAMLRRDWPEAARAAATWRALEPTALDPIVDLAQALEQQGDAVAAARAYEELGRRPDLPAPVLRTIDAYRSRQGPVAAGSFRIDHADGFAGQRLLARRDTLLAGETTVGPSPAFRLDGQVAEGVLDTGEAGATQAVTEGRVGLRAALGAGWTLSGHVGGTDVAGRTQATGDVRLVVPAGSRLRVEGALERRPFWENAATLSAGLQATTGRLGIRMLGTGPLDVSAGLDVGHISDGTRRRQVDAQVARRFGRGRQVYVLRASAFVFGFDASREAYFSPAAFGRLDAEAGLTRWFGPGAVVRDGRFALQGQGGMGVDTDGVPYGLASGGLVVPVAGMLSVAAEGRWTSARVYRAWSATVGLRLQPGTVAVGTSRTHGASSTVKQE